MIVGAGELVHQTAQIGTPTGKAPLIYSAINVAMGIVALREVNSGGQLSWRPHARRIWHVVVGDRVGINAAFGNESALGSSMRFEPEEACRRPAKRLQGTGRQPRSLLRRAVQRAGGGARRSHGYPAGVQLWPRPIKLDADTQWLVSWPSMGRDVFIRGRHRELAKYYQVDAGKSEAGSVKSAGRGKFAWSGTKAAKLAFKAEEMLFCVRIQGLGTKSNDAPIADRLPVDAQIFLPAQIELAPEPAKEPTPPANPDVGHPPSDRLPARATNSRSLRVNLVANKSLSGVRFTAVGEWQV